MNETFNWWILAGASLTWLLFILSVAQLSRFYSKFLDTRKEIDANLLVINGMLKKIHAALAEMAIEQRRSTRLMVEQVDLKKAEMTGEFEIVEEPLPPPTQPPATPGITLPGEK